MWTSKLGNKYPKSWMHEQDGKTQKELKALRKERGNDYCSDCGQQDTSWASVTHGVFICVTCSDVHRSVGTHISKVKGCTGTYLWGPDEMEMMRSVGNRRADATFGTKKISPDSTKEQKQRYVVDKYVNRAFVTEASSARDGGSAVSKPPYTVMADYASAKQPLTQPRSHMVQVASVQQRADLSTPSVVVKNIDLPDSLFDELFGEGIQPASVPKLAKQPLQPKQDHAADTCNDFSDLDAFLNDCLSA